MAAGKHQFALMLSAILPVLSACAQLHGVLLMMIMYQLQQRQITHCQIILDINKVAAKLRTIVVRINRVINMNPPSVYMRKYGKFQPS